MCPRKRPVAVASLALVLAYACVESTSTTRGPAASSAGAGAAPASSGANGTGGGTTDRSAVLAALADKVVLATYREFAEAANALEAAAKAYAAGLGATERGALRQAFAEAMLLWQRAELMQVGPAGAADKVAGGQDLRDNIYSWPLVNRCRVDQELVEGAYADKEAFGSELINVRGLAALEYLLYYEGTANACPPQNVINADGLWQKITGELPKRRADYAVTLCYDLSKRATALRDAWEPSKGNFVTELAGAGAVYGSAQKALNAVSDALFYLDYRTKDVKLAVPAGLSPDCAAASCPEQVESPYAKLSRLQIEANLEGAALVLFGGAAGDPDALGFDDLLAGLGAGDLGLAAAFDGARAALGAIADDDLAVAVVRDPAGVKAAHAALKAVTDILKSQLVSVLDLELPQIVEGDND
jgi:predicted lipoprotein